MSEIKKIVNGDRVNFDFEGFMNGQPFQGGSANGFTLVIGSGQFIPGFEDGMIGMEIGTEKDIKLTFPKDYHADHLAGEEVIFKVKINSIKKGN